MLRFSIKSGAWGIAAAAAPADVVVEVLLGVWVVFGADALVVIVEAVPREGVTDEATGADVVWVVDFGLSLGLGLGRGGRGMSICNSDGTGVEDVGALGAGWLGTGVEGWVSIESSTG